MIDIMIAINLLPYVSPTTDVCIVVANGFLCSSGIDQEKVMISSGFVVDDLQQEEITYDF